MGHSHALLAAAVLSVTGAAVLGCGPAVPEYEVVQTPSGADLKLEAVYPSMVGSQSALLLVYHSDVDLSDTRALEAEIQDAWTWLRPRVEAGGYGIAVIRATRWERPGWERYGRATEFVLRRTSEGGWRAAAGDES